MAKSPVRFIQRMITEKVMVLASHPNPKALPKHSPLQYS